PQSFCYTSAATPSIFPLSLHDALPILLGSFVNVDVPFCLSPHTARAVTTPQIVDNVTWVHGAHTLRAGINFRFYIHNDSRGFFRSEEHASELQSHRHLVCRLLLEKKKK